MDKLRTLQVGGVQANATNVRSGTYPFVRPLFMYTSAEILERKPQVQAYLTYRLTRGEDLVQNAGYFPLDRLAYREAKSRLRN